MTFPDWSLPHWVFVVAYSMLVVPGVGWALYTLVRGLIDLFRGD